MRWAALALAAGALAGCAAVTTKVTNFNAWPQDAPGGTFSFKSPEGKQADLEQDTYETWIGAELERRGLRRAAAGQAPRFVVEVAAAGTVRRRTYLEPVYTNQLIYVPPWRGPGAVYGGYYQESFGSRYVGDREVTRTLFVSRLKVKVSDHQGGGVARPVFDSTAVYEGNNEDLPDLVPYLARALFDDFPGRSGQVKIVRFDPKSGEKIGQR